MKLPVSFHHKFYPFLQKEQMQQHICSLQVSRICGAHTGSYMKRESFAQDVKLMRIRTMLARSVYGCIEAVTKTESKNKETETVKLLKDSWADLFEVRTMHRHRINI